MPTAYRVDPSKPVDVVFTVTRLYDQDKYTVTGQDVYSTGDVSVVKQRLGEFDAPEDAILFAACIDDPVLAVYRERFTEDQIETIKAAIRKNEAYQSVVNSKPIRVRSGNGQLKCWKRLPDSAT